jgi:phosphoadenosine phosphosulfate reductase
MKDLFGDKVERAIELLKMYQPKDKPYYGCFSGGKDSCVIKEIARLAGVSVTWHYNVTTIDPPELCRFIKHEHPDVVWNKPKENFFNLAARKGFPTRKARWCCEVFKESRSPSGSVLIMGVRAAESTRRAKQWKEVTAHTRTGQYVISPIVGWKDYEVWQFIRESELPYCSLYDQGFKRLGCVGCPMAGSGRIRQFRKWPHFERSWKKIVFKAWERSTINNFKSPDDLWEWWLNSRNSPPNDDECQGILDMYS